MAFHRNLLTKMHSRLRSLKVRGGATAKAARFTCRRSTPRRPGGWGATVNRSRALAIDLQYFVSILSVHPYQIELAKPYRWAKGVQTHRVGFVVKIEFDGCVGLGEATLLPNVLHDAIKFARQCELMLDGLNPVEDNFLDQLDARECPPAIRCGVSSAYFSYAASKKGLQLCTLFAAQRPAAHAVPVNALITDQTPRQCVEAAKQHVSRGIRTVKLKCGKDRKSDTARIEAVRGDFPGLNIRIDPNQSWDVEWATEHLRSLEPFDIQYCEEPLPSGTSFDVYRHLREDGGVAIALDESIVDLNSAELAIEKSAADYLVLKLQRLGGMDRLLDVAKFAKSCHVDSILTSSMEATVGLAVGLHCAAVMQSPGLDSGLATADFFADGLDPLLAVVDGCMRVPTGRGTGVTYSKLFQRKL